MIDYDARDTKPPHTRVRTHTYIQARTHARTYVHTRTHTAAVLGTYSVTRNQDTISHPLPLTIKLDLTHFSSLTEPLHKVIPPLRVSSLSDTASNGLITK